MLDQKDADRLLAEFKKDVAFRDQLLADPAGAAAKVGITLQATDVASIKADAAEIRKSVQSNLKAGELVPTLVKIIKWTT